MFKNGVPALIVQLVDGALAMQQMGSWRSEQGVFLAATAETKSNSS